MSLTSGIERRVEPEQSPRSMIIVENEATVSMLIGMFAEELGWQVAGTAYSQSAALNLLEDVSPTIAVIDINLGSPASFEVAAACRGRGIPVLFITGFADDHVPDECGDDPRLAKPFSVDEFKLALSQSRARGDNT